MPNSSITTLWTMANGNQESFFVKIWAGKLAKFTLKTPSFFHIPWFTRLVGGMGEDELAPEYKQPSQANFFV